MREQLRGQRGEWATVKSLCKSKLEAKLVDQIPAWDILRLKTHLDYNTSQDPDVAEGCSYTIKDYCVLCSASNQVGGAQGGDTLIPTGQRDVLFHMTLCSSIKPRGKRKRGCSGLGHLSSFPGNHCGQWKPTLLGMDKSLPAYEKW